MISVVIKFTVLLIMLSLCFSVEYSIVFREYALSNMHIAFVMFLAIITSCKYTVLKYGIESKSTHKFLKCVIFLIAVFIVINAIYFVIPDYYSINDWFWTDYNSEEEQLIDFIFLPTYYDSLNILKMTAVETVFSLILVYLSYLREKKSKGYTAYILEKILKKSFRYNLAIVFLIYLLTVPNKFLFVRRVKYIGVGILFFALLVEFIIIYLSLKGCKNKNNEKYGKENLIIIMTSTNYTFCLSDYIINPLHVFYRYDNKNLVKSLLVSGKKYTFVLYDAIRYELIDISQYKGNIAYIIMINQDLLIESNKKIEFKQKLDDIASKTKKFIIYKNGSFLYKPTVLRELASQYSFKVKEKLDLKDVLDVVNIEPSADELKVKVKSLLEYIQRKELDNYLEREYKDGRINNEGIESKKIQFQTIIETIPLDNEEKTEIDKKLKEIEEEKNIYLKYGLKVILGSFNYMEYFYTLLKMSEYVIHYMGLKSVLEETDSVQKADCVKLGSWRELLEFNKEYLGKDTEKIQGIVSQAEIANSIMEINKLVNSSQKSRRVENNILEKYSFKDICKTVGDIRNKILVHGAISHQVAKNMVNHLFNIFFILVKEFEELNVTIEDDEKIKNIFEKDMLAVYRYSDKLFLYSNSVLENKKVIYNECINYETGKKKVIDADAHIDIDTIYSMEQIKEKLGKWM